MLSSIVDWTHMLIFGFFWNPNKVSVEGLLKNHEFILSLKRRKGEHNVNNILQVGKLSNDELNWSVKAEG